jgi:hypothetical protein
LERAQTESEKGFKIFDVYINESREDHGVLMASSLDFEDEMIAVLAKMREEHLHYLGK